MIGSEIQGSSLSNSLLILLEPSYILMAALWFLVAFHYGRAAYFTWKKLGRAWYEIPVDLLEPLCWGIGYTLNAGYRFVTRQPQIKLPRKFRVPSRLDGGSLLRGAIFLGSFGPLLAGVFFWNVDRTNLTETQLLLTALNVGVSILSALMHLFLAYRVTPRLWASVVTVVGVYLLVDIFLSFN